jgi:hypothetical protein
VRNSDVPAIMSTLHSAATLRAWGGRRITCPAAQQTDSTHIERVPPPATKRKPVSSHAHSGGAAQRRNATQYQQRVWARSHAGAGAWRSGVRTLTERHVIQLQPAAQ